MTNSQMEIKLNTIEKRVYNIEKTLTNLNDDIQSRIHASELQIQKEELKQLIRDNANLILDIQKRLAKVVLPNETKYYLEESDIEDFKSNFSKLKAMMVRFERLYNNLVSYTTNNTN